MTKKRKIYISIPITGLDERTQRAKADALKTALSKQGWEVVNPFEIYAGKNPTWEDYICSDIRALMECDAIYMCEGWIDSCGCCIEFDVAMDLRVCGRRAMEIIYENQDQREEHRLAGG